MLAFDTLSAAKNLQEAGMDMVQAEAVAMVVQSSQGGLATKSDIDSLRTEMDAQFKDVNAQFKVAKNDIDSLRTEMRSDRHDRQWLKWVMGLNLAATLALIAIVVTVLIQPAVP